MHKNETKSFWLLLAERTGADYIDTDRYCPVSPLLHARVRYRGPAAPVRPH